jgi:hypothetical protein
MATLSLQISIAHLLIEVLVVIALLLLVAIQNA